MTDPKTILAAVLDWSIAMGADGAVADEAVNWLEEGRGPPGSGFALGGDERGAEANSVPTPVQPERSARPGAVPPVRGPVQPVAPPARKFATAAPDVAVAAARAAARQARSLDDLQRVLQTFDGCGLKATAKNLCFYRGAAQAPVMVIGDAPGRDEDMEGRPFAGRAGQLLDRIVAAAGWSDTDVHIAAAVYWRPPGNRQPTTQEMDVCRPFLERQIELVAPRVLVLMGGIATKQILRSDEAILNIRGQWQSLAFGELKVPAIATLPPGYLMKTPIAKQQVWRDILSVKEVLAKPSRG